MSELPIAPATTGYAGAEEHSPSARLHGGWLVGARASWMLIASICLILVIYGTPVEFAGYSSPCAATCDRPQLTMDAVRELADMGMSTTIYAAYNMGLELLFVLVWAAVAGVIFW